MVLTTFDKDKIILISDSISANGRGENDLQIYLNRRMKI